MHFLGPSRLWVHANHAKCWWGPQQRGIYLGCENHWTEIRADMLAIIKLHQILPYIAKENRCTAPHVLITKSFSGKRLGDWSWRVRDLTSPQFASRLQTRTFSLCLLQFCGCELWIKAFLLWQVCCGCEYTSEAFKHYCSKGEMGSWLKWSVPTFLGIKSSGIIFKKTSIF